MLSIVTLNKNHADGLRRTLESIQAQRVRDFEVIIIDGHSTDGSADVVAEFADIVTSFEVDLGHGIYEAMNQGIDAASLEWTIFLNAGDSFSDPDVLQEVDLGVEADIVVGKARYQDCADVISYRREGAAWTGMFLCHQAAFCRTEVLRETPFDTTFRIAGDYDFFSRALTTGRRFIDIPRTVAVIERGGVSDTHQLRRLREDYRVAARYFKEAPVHRHYLRALGAYTWRWMAEKALRLPVPRPN